MVEIIALSLSVATFFGGIYAYWRSRLVQQVNADRDMKHVSGNLANLSSNLNVILKESEEGNAAILDHLKELQSELKELKGLSHAQGQRIEFLRERILGGNSLGFGPWGNQ